MFSLMAKALNNSKARARAKNQPATGEVHPALEALAKYLARRAAERDHAASREHSETNRPCGGKRDSE